MEQGFPEKTTPPPPVLTPKLGGPNEIYTYSGFFLNRLKRRQESTVKYTDSQKIQTHIQ